MPSFVEQFEGTGDGVARSNVPDIGLLSISESPSILPAVISESAVGDREPSREPSIGDRGIGVMTLARELLLAFKL